MIPEPNSSPDPTQRHPHPAPPADLAACGVLVIGGGHAGVEAALAAARLGVRVQLLSMRLDLLGEMSCNPAIGGLGKGQIVREIDALGGIMGRVADATGIQFRMLNTRKGAAVRAPRCQSDRHAYREEVCRLVAATPGVELVEGCATELLVDDSAGGARRVRGVRMADGSELLAAATIFTTGTFLRAIMHMGEAQSEGGRVGEGSAKGLSAELVRLGLDTSRLKTGTPPRLDGDSIAWEQLDEQWGDALPAAFSYATQQSDFPRLKQVACHITHTNEATHSIIRDNIHRAPMYAGRIEGVGPRYCPSVEDKVMRFADKKSHQIFLEPESLRGKTIYANGISTSLPEEVQAAFLHTVPGLEKARFLRHGYAVEYDFVQPCQLADTLAVRSVSGLFLAGQINGTSGYEEAAGQGLLAGANAALWIQDRAPFVLGRHEAFMGVMVDDLILSNPSEPYRMFSSRAEYRLLLRQDNADRRLTKRAAEVGLAAEADLNRVLAKELEIDSALALCERVRGTAGKTVAELLRRPEVDFAGLAQLHPELQAPAFSAAVIEAVEIEFKYAGYIKRQEETVARMARQEHTELPAGFDYGSLVGLASEAREKLARLRPRTLGAAGRIAGVRPPDVSLLAIHLERWKRAGRT